MQINQVILTVYVAKDPERPFPAITSSSLANKNTITLENGAKKTHTTFMDLTFIGELGKSFFHRVKKGDHVLIQGELRQSNWQEEDGTNRSKLYVKVNSFQFTQFKRSGETAAPGEVEDGLD